MANVRLQPIATLSARRTSPRTCTGEDPPEADEGRPDGPWGSARVVGSNTTTLRCRAWEGSSWSSTAASVEPAPDISPGPRALPCRHQDPGERSMCGRFTRMMTWEEIVQGLRILSLIDSPQVLEPRYNIRPGEPDGALVFRTTEGQVHPDRLKWGFRPDGKKPFAPINAKSETLFEKWPWKYAAIHRRCLLPMDGFYEPKGPPTQKQRPQFFFRFPDGGAFFVAAIWAPRTEGAALGTFALVTTEPNGQVSPIHERMPAIVEPDAHELWLSDSKDVTALLEVLKPWGGDPLDSWEVDRRRLNDADDERCVEPLGPIPEG